MEALTPATALTPTARLYLTIGLIKRAKDSKGPMIQGARGDLLAWHYGHGKWLVIGRSFKSPDQNAAVNEVVRVIMAK